MGTRVLFFRSRIVLLFSVLANAVLGIGFFYFYNRTSAENVIQTTQKPTKTYKIAIVIRASAPMVDFSVKGFIERLNEKGTAQYDYTIYNAKNDRTLLRSSLEEIIDRSDYDLIFTLGGLCSKIAVEMTRKKGHKVPLVFAGVGDPVSLDLVPSRESSGCHITGVSAEDTSKYDEVLDYLFLLKTSIKNILLVYNSSAESLEEIAVPFVQKVVESKGATLSKVSVFQTNELIQKVSPYIQDTDVVMTLRDSVVTSGMVGLAKLCSMHGVTLCASDLNSVENGAAFGFSDFDEDTGRAAAEKVLQILEEGKHPSEIPITIPTYHYRVRINSKTAAAQNLHIDEKMLFLMQNSEII